jgi:hypothetical protein
MMKLQQRAAVASDGPGATGRDGVVLLVVMLVVASMTLLGGIALMVSKIQLRGVSYYRQGASAFASADAGARYVFRRIDADTAAGTLKLYGDAAVSVNYPAPTGFSFDTVTSLTALSDGQSYLYRVRGRSTNGRSTIETVIHVTLDGFPYTFFGGGGIELTSNADVTAAVGSNGDISIRSGARIIGDASSGAGHTPPGSGQVSGTSMEMLAPVVIPPVDPVALVDAISNNNNAALPSGSMSGGAFSAKGGKPLTMPSGTYYFTEMSVKTDIVLTGPVVIYCSGPIDIGSSCTVGTPGNTENLHIYSTSSGSVSLGSSSEFYGNIVAPNASGGFVGSSSEYYGSLVVGGLLTTGSSSDFDDGTGGNGAVYSTPVTRVSWKEVRP